MPNEGRAMIRSCVKVEVDVLGSPCLKVCAVSVDFKQHLKKLCTLRSSGAVWKSRWTSWAPRPVPNSPCGFCGRKSTFEEVVYHSLLGSSVKVEMDVLGSPPQILIIVLMQLWFLWTWSNTWRSSVSFIAQELCESRSGRPGLPVLNTSNSPYGFCGLE